MTAFWLIPPRSHSILLSGSRAIHRLLIQRCSLESSSRSGLHGLASGNGPEAPVLMAAAGMACTLCFVSNRVQPCAHSDTVIHLRPWRATTQSTHIQASESAHSAPPAIPKLLGSTTKKQGRSLLGQHLSGSEPSLQRCAALLLLLKTCKNNMTSDNEHNLTDAG